MNNIQKAYIASLVIFGLWGCGDKNGPSPASSELAANEDTDNYFTCNYRDRQIAKCLSSKSAPMIERIQNTLRSYDRNASWPVELLQTQSFEKRFSLTEEQRTCVVKTICREVYL